MSRFGLGRSALGDGIGTFDYREMRNIKNRGRTISVPDYLGAFFQVAELSAALGNESGSNHVSLNFIIKLSCHPFPRDATAGRIPCLGSCFYPVPKAGIAAGSAFL